MIDSLKIVRVRPQNGWLVRLFINGQIKISKNYTDEQLIQLLSSQF